jgi:protein-tyrosine phosphatase
VNILRDMKTDWHSHILPGIDDGAETLEHSLAMAASLSAAGFETVYCTPHLMRGCYEADNGQVRKGVAELQDQLERRSIPLTLLPGREYCLDEYLLTSLEDPLPLGDSRLVLVEIPGHVSPDMIRHLLYGVVRAGFTPVIAHPERCPLLEPRRVENTQGFFDLLRSLFSRSLNSEHGSSNPERGTSNSLLDYLRDLGCSFQGNLGSFNGFYGGRVQSTAVAMKTLGVYDRYGSDLHAPEQAGMILRAVDG